MMKARITCGFSTGGKGWRWKGDQSWGASFSSSWKGGGKAEEEELDGSDAELSVPQQSVANLLLPHIADKDINSYKKLMTQINKMTPAQMTGLVRKHKMKEAVKVKPGASVSKVLMAYLEKQMGIPPPQ